MNNDKMKKDFKKYYRSKYPYNMSILEDYEKKATVSPYILEEREMHVTQMDVFSRLMAERQIFFTSAVTSETASIIVAQLMYLDSVSGDDIIMNILSPGGECSAGMSIVDTMGYINADVSTINIGMCASMGSCLLAAGKKGKRKSLPNASVLIHQPLISGGGISGPTADILIEAKQMELLRERLFKFLAIRTGQPYEKLCQDAQRDFWLNAEESLAYGIVDEIINIDWAKK